eukprot:281254-Rhodomonas_salina.1
MPCKVTTDLHELRLESVELAGTWGLVTLRNLQPLLHLLLEPPYRTSMHKSQYGTFRSRFVGQLRDATTCAFLICATSFPSCVRTSPSPGIRTAEVSTDNAHKRRRSTKGVPVRLCA